MTQIHDTTRCSNNKKNNENDNKKNDTTRCRQYLSQRNTNTKTHTHTHKRNSIRIHQLKHTCIKTRLKHEPPPQYIGAKDRLRTPQAVGADTITESARYHFAPKNSYWLESMSQKKAFSIACFVKIMISIIYRDGSRLQKTAQCCPPGKGVLRQLVKGVLKWSPSWTKVINKCQSSTGVVLNLCSCSVQVVPKKSPMVAFKLCQI